LQCLISFGQLGQIFLQNNFSTAVTVLIYNPPLVHVEKGDIITLVGGVICVLFIVILVKPGLLSSVVTPPVVHANPIEIIAPPSRSYDTSTISFQNISSKLVNSTTLEVLSLPEPYRIFYSTKPLDAPRLFLPDNMETFGASDNPGREQDMIPFAYLEESRGGITGEFNIPYDIWTMNITVSPNQRPQYANFRMVLCDAKNGTVLEGAEILNSGTILKNVQVSNKDMYLIISTQNIDKYRITFETPRKYYNKYHLLSNSSKQTTISGISTQQLETKPVIKSLSYIIRGMNKHIDYQMYGGVNDYLSGNIPSTQKGDTYYIQQYNQQLMNNDVQNKYLQDLVEKIKKNEDIRDDQARIAISLTQQFYYDKSGTVINDSRIYYPYETIYLDRGVCIDKNVLLAYLLKELGYGVAIFVFGPEQHAVVGVKAPVQYTYKNTGYAFVDATCPMIPTWSGKLYSDPIVIPISDGVSFDSISEEYYDAQEFNRIIKLVDQIGLVLPEVDYYSAQRLRQKYGMVQVYQKDVCR